MFCQLVSHLRRSHATKNSTNRYVTTQVGAIVPSSEPPHKPRLYLGNPTTNQKGKGIVNLQSPIVTVTTSVGRRSHQLLIAIAWYTFLLEVKGCVESSGKAKGIDVSYRRERFLLIVDLP